MNLRTELSNHFESSIQTRGWGYFANGAVWIELVTDHVLHAQVIGSQEYDVSIELRDGTLSLTCTCPYYRANGPCKHLWAVILQADGEKFLHSTPRTSLFRIVFGDPLMRAIDRPPDWKRQLERILPLHASRKFDWPDARRLLYVIGAGSTDELTVRLMYSDPKQSGGWLKPKALRIARLEMALLPDAADREIMLSLAGARDRYSFHLEDLQEFSVDGPLAALLLPRIVATGRAMREAGGQATVLEWDDGGAWTFGLRAVPRKTEWELQGVFRRGGEEIEIHSPSLITPEFLFRHNTVARFEIAAGFEWIVALRKGDPILIAANQVDDAIATLLTRNSIPPIELPPEWRVDQVSVTPRVRLSIRGARSYAAQRERLIGTLSFDYAGKSIPSGDKSSGAFDHDLRRILLRDTAAEAAAQRRLDGLKLQQVDTGWEIPHSKLPVTVRTLIGDGWSVEADGKSFRSPGAHRLSVASGVDWFELHGEVDYGGVSVSLPKLLAALRRGETMVRLDDGAFGLLPEEWLSQFKTVTSLGAAEDDHIRFRRNQAGLLDALIAAQPGVPFDETFARLRARLQRFQGISPAPQPAGFTGLLRDYQREGLGWMHFLNEYGFGGCLADDMGVGKTAQVLALFEERRAQGRTSLVVVPKSLIFNWQQEAARFTPQLRVLDHTGITRTTQNFSEYDIVLTTYGTLRRDILHLKEVSFDYVVLDEAQAVKNANTESAKAVRLLKADHRLALSGTPVENHLGELFSMFEFLNPGMLGALSMGKFRELVRNPSPETKQTLAHALRPFILRRTKEQVAKELPAKTEQTIYCEMEPLQRKLYDELRLHYRNALLGRIEKLGLAKSKMHVLEALLRLRQAACHPGLLDPKRAHEPSAKLDLLLSHLSEVVEEGHKALVFSQFTSFLSLLRTQLDDAGLVYEYLDGSTTNRQACVERFQNDPDCPLFLISLKAGGLGLNLTAADYVFLLDPWWNPAVEAQAVDRAHRIGQQRHVFAYRLIAKDTVEEKILELQSSKRDLAASIIGEDNSVIRDLKREDLELLLS